MKDSEHPQKNPLVELSRDDSHDSTFFQASPARLPGGGPVQHDGGVQRSNNDDTPGISYDLFTSFFKGKFEGLEKRLRDALTQRNQDTVEVEFKYKGNKLQFLHNANVVRKLEEAKRETELGGNPDVCAAKLEEVIKDVRTRNKHIRIADASPGGWETVDEYSGKSAFADNEDDAKHIRKAEACVLQRRKQQREWRPARGRVG